MLKWVSFREQHLDLFQPVELYKEDVWQSASWLDQMGRLNQAGTHIIDGKILYISAYFQVTNDTWEAFIIPSVNIKTFAKTIIKDARVHLEYIRLSKNAVRLQTWGDPTAQMDHWHHMLGFTCEGTLRKYNNDIDKRVWSIIDEDIKDGILRVCHCSRH